MYGLTIFQSQILPKIKNNEEKIVIKIPDEIKEISPGFLKGLCLKWLLEQDNNLLFEKIEVISNTPDLQFYICNVLLEQSALSKEDKQYICPTFV